MACSALSALCGALVFATCSSEEHTPYLRGRAVGGSGAGGDGLDLGTTGPPPPDADSPWICGNVVHQVIVDAPNLYFVLDASGSMAEPSSIGTRYDAVRVAAVDLVRKLGPLVNVGAAVFPRYATEAHPCHVGAEVFPVTPGDPTTGEDGPTTEGFISSTLAAPSGGTPTSATLEALTPTLEALPGKTFVLLATDGGPNCNPQSASCTANECTANLDGSVCSPDINCCAPGGPSGPLMCLDRSETVAAIATIAGAGIPVYVIGIPGSEVYADVLGEMALAGNAAQPNAPYYYKVDELDAVGAVLSSIADVVVTCDFDLVDPPEAPGNTNVYFDQELVPFDPVDGWIWTSDKTIAIVGASCDRLKNGQVKQVQIVSGCPTETK